LKERERERERGREGERERGGGARAELVSPPNLYPPPFFSITITHRRPRGDVSHTQEPNVDKERATERERIRARKRERERESL
jgi:hypothetical protein